MSLQFCHYSRYNLLVPCSLSSCSVHFILFSKLPSVFHQCSLLFRLLVGAFETLATNLLSASMARFSSLHCIFQVAKVLFRQSLIDGIVTSHAKKCGRKSEPQNNDSLFTWFLIDLGRTQSKSIYRLCLYHIPQQSDRNDNHLVTFLEWCILNLVQQHLERCTQVLQMPSKNRTGTTVTELTKH